MEICMFFFEATGLVLDECKENRLNQKNISE